MLASGIGLVRSLELLAESEEPEFQWVCSRLSLAVASGFTFSRALSQEPRSFPPSYCRIIQSGELTGKLIACLRRLSRTHQRQDALKQVVKKAVTYPLVLLFASAVMVGLVLYLVFPMILKFTIEAGVDPPAITKLVIRLADPQAFGIAVCGILVLYCIYKVAMLTPSRANWIRYVFESYTPPGRFYAQTQSLMSLRQFALMLECGTDMLRSLRVSGQIGEGSFLVQRAFVDLEKRVKAGEPLSEGVATHSVFSPTFAALMEIAEELGDIHTIIYQFCDLSEDQLQSRIRGMSAAFEPLLMGGMGFVVGTVLLAAFLPVYQLVTL